MAIGDPGTITFSTEPNIRGGALGASPNVPTLGIQGGGVGQAGPVLSGSDWFQSVGGMEMPDSNLPQFLQELTAPAMQRLKQQQMWDGFVAARQGKTMQEISEEQPWYTKVFGPTNYEIGAQTYNVLRSVSDMEQDLVARMPELRKLPPEEMAQEFNRLSQEQLTGNTYADALLQKTFMDRAGPLMDMHTKERYAWQQGELVKAQYAAGASASTALHEMSKRSSMLGAGRPADAGEAEKLVQSQTSFLDSIQPSRFETDDAYKSFMTSLVRGAADRGEFYTLKFLDQNGALSALDPDDMLGLKSYVKQAESQYRNTYLDQNPAMAERMALVGLLASQGEGAKPTEAHIDELNSQYAAETGSADPLYSGTQRLSLMAQSAGQHIAAQEAVLRARASAAKEANTEAAKLAAKEEDVRGAITAFDHGTYSQAVNVPGVDKELFDASVTQAWNKTFSTNPQVAFSRLVQNAASGRGAVIKGVSEQFKNEGQTVLREQFNDAAAQLYAKWRALKNTKAQRLDANGNVVESSLTGATTAALYFGDDVNKLFNKMQVMLDSNVPIELAYETARGEIATDDPTQFVARSKQESEAINGRVADVLQSANPRFLGYFGNRLGKYGRMAAARALVRAVDQSGGLLDTSEDGLTEGLRAAKLKFGGEDAGKYYWENGRDDEGNAIQSVGAWLGFLDTKETGPAIEEAIDTALRAHNIEPSRDMNVDIFRMRDSEGGEPVLYVKTITDRGFKVVPVVGSDIRATYEKRAKAQRRVQVPVPQGYIRTPDGRIEQSIQIQPKF